MVNISGIIDDEKDIILPPVFLLTAPSPKTFVEFVPISRPLSGPARYARTCSTSLKSRTHRVYQGLRVALVPRHCKFAPAPAVGVGREFTTAGYKTAPRGAEGCLDRRPPSAVQPRPCSRPVRGRGLAGGGRTAYGDVGGAGPISSWPGWPYGQYIFVSFRVRGFEIGGVLLASVLGPCMARAVRVVIRRGDRRDSVGKRWKNAVCQGR